MLSEQAISKFKEIYFTEFGKKLSDEKANELGIKLLNFMKLIYRPIPKNYSTDFQEKDEF